MKINALLSIFLISVAALSADTKIVEGEMRFLFRLESGSQELLDSFFEYQNNSNSQKIIERGSNYIVVENKADLSPLKSSVPYPIASLYQSEDLKPYLDYSTSRKGIEISRGGGELIKREFVEKSRLSHAEIQLLRERARSVVTGAEYQHEAVEMLMRYIRKHVSYSLQSSSNPADVLRTGKAYCEGYANVAALMLRVIGIPAKVVDSYIPPGHMWGYGQQGGGGFHAHVEVFYQDAGWVSYDPQATVHYVDPFHIVDFPRERVRLRQLEQEDNRNIRDVLSVPENWNNFFQRDTDERQVSPLLVGRIYDQSGKLVKDSFRSNEWVYLRKEDGGGAGVRILANGEFALSPAAHGNERIREPLTFFYRNQQGAWIEEHLSFDEREVRSRTYRLDQASRTIRLQLEANRSLYLWYPSEDGRWKLDQIRPDRQGRIHLISSNGKWIVSDNRQAVSPKYLLAAEDLKPGRIYRLDDLPRYTEAGKSYLKISFPAQMGEIAKSVGDFSLRFTDLSTARRYSPITLEQNPVMVEVPDPDYSTLVFKGPQALSLLELSREIEIGGIAEVDIAAKGRLITVRSDSPGYQIHLGIRQGRRFAEVARGRTGADGKLDLYLSPSFFEDSPQELYIFHGNPPGSQRVKISDIQGSLYEVVESAE